MNSVESNFWEKKGFLLLAAQLSLSRVSVRVFDFVSVEGKKITLPQVMSSKSFIHVFVYLIYRRGAGYLNTRDAFHSPSLETLELIPVDLNIFVRWCCW